jgi:cation diffusion facilitator CzcD-associated flavoprotein CzcO
MGVMIKNATDVTGGASTPAVQRPSTSSSVQVQPDLQEVEAEATTSTSTSSTTVSKKALKLEKKLEKKLAKVEKKHKHIAKKLKVRFVCCWLVLKGEKTVVLCCIVLYCEV